MLPPGYEAWSLGAGGVIARRDVAAAVRAARRQGLGLDAVALTDENPVRLPRSVCRGPFTIGPIEVKIREGEEALVTALT